MQTQSKFRLLVVRLGAMGDILHALPAVAALRAAHPGWTIDWVVEPSWTALLTSQLGAHSGAVRSPAKPLVDNILLAPIKAWGKSPLSLRTFSGILDLRKILHQRAYDAVLDFQGAVRSAWIARMARSRRVIGEARPREPLAKFLYTERVPTHGVHVIEQDVEVAAAVAGDILEPLQPTLPIDPSAENWCNTLLKGDRKPLALLNPGAGWGAKRWPVERYAVVATELAARGFRIVVNAGPGEEYLAEAARELSRGIAIPARCTLAQLIALTRRASLVIAGDTGPLHLACALGKPVVGIFGPTDPARNGPYGSPFRVLRNSESKRDHSRREEPEAGLLTIEPQDVLHSIAELLAEVAQ